MDILSIIIFLPLLATLLIALLPNAFEKQFKHINLVVSMVQVILAFSMIAGFDASGGFQFVKQVPWLHLDLGSIGALNIEYHVAVDGLSIALILLSAIVMLIASISSYEITNKLKSYFVLFGILNMSVMGVFVAMDFFLFYIFYELMLLPLYFLIGIWGGANREYASIKFFLYTLFGSVFILLVMLGLYFSVANPADGSHSFNMLHMMDSKNYIRDSFLGPYSEYASIFGYSSRFLAFIVLFVGFAIKVPIVPFHTWLPDAHVEAPTPVSIILAGILLKVGGYAIIRICYGIFPDAAIHFSYYIALLGTISIIYGALNALAADDLKRMIAYSSVSHMGFVLIGVASLTSEGMNGAVYQLFSHGILSAMLFYLVGVIYNRVHDREIANFRGLSQQMPKYTVFVIIAFFASLGLPGFSGFIAEVFTLLGAFKSSSQNAMVPQWMAVVSAFGILLGAAYFLWTIQRMFFGEKGFKLTEWTSQLKDLKPIEYTVLIPLSLMTLIIGIFPSYLFDLSNADVNVFINDVLSKGYRYLSNAIQMIK